MEARHDDWNEVVSRTVDLKTARDRALEGIVAAGEDFALARALWIRAKVYNRGLVLERGAGDYGSPLARAPVGSAARAREDVLF